jgi:diguanylate cyclase (GGDEF)-like protein
VVLVNPGPASSSDRLYEALLEKTQGKQRINVVVLSNRAEATGALSVLLESDLPFGTVYSPPGVGAELAAEFPDLDVQEIRREPKVFLWSEEEGLHLVPMTTPQGEPRLLAIDRSSGVLFGGDFLKPMPGSSASSIADTGPATAPAKAPVQADASLCPITGLPGEEAFRKQMRQLIRNKRPAGAVLFLGADRLQEINAAFGRVGGDEALYGVSHVLRNFRRDGTALRNAGIFRYAGPEFTFLLPDATQEEAQAIAETIRQRVAESTLFLTQLTVSIGVVYLSEIDLDSSDALETIEQTGQFRLEIARSSGANTVCDTSPEEFAAANARGTVLVVEPDADYMEILLYSLEAAGFTTILSRDGREALEAIHQIVPDVIVSEAILPKLNGFGLREALRHSAELSDIPFVLLSHRKDEEMIKKAALQGIVHFLPKPVLVQEIVGMVRNLARSTA